MNTPPAVRRKRRPLRWWVFFTPRGFRAAFRGLSQYVFGKRAQGRIFSWRTFYRLRTEMTMRSPSAITGMSGFPIVKLWVDREAFPRIKKLLRRARYTIFIQMFIWKDDRLGRDIARILVDAADRGVQVDISKEAVGDMFEFRRDFLTTKKSHNTLWQRFWNHKNIRVNYATHNDHAKVYIIDDKIFLLTGMNIAREYHESWHDYLVELRGRNFVEHYLTSGERPGRLGEATLVMNTSDRREIRPTVMKMLAEARHSIVLEQAYFSDPAVLELLVKRSQEGIAIVLILPEKTDYHYYSNMDTIASLLKAGNRERITVFLYPRMIHGKIIMIDREQAFVGSANLMTTSLDTMGEVNVLYRGRLHPAMRKLREVLREDILISTPMSRPPRLRWLWTWLTLLKL